MELYTDGDFDAEKAAREVASASRITSAQVRNDNLAIVKAAALVDIAASLNTLALESALRMRDAGEFIDPAFEPDDGSAAVIDWQPGDRARLYEDTLEGTVLALSEREGEVAARVEWDDGTESLVFVQLLMSASEPTADSGLDGSVVELEPLPVADLEPDPDDIDGDFDGDPHPAAADGLAALRALEKKPSKKGKKK